MNRVRLNLKSIPAARYNTYCSNLALRFKQPTHIMSRHLTTLDKLQRSSTFTDALPADSVVPDEAAFNSVEDAKARTQRRVLGMYTFLRPEERNRYQLLAYSKPALRDLGLKDSEAQTQEFQDFVAGKYAGDRKNGDPLPYAAAYAGHQFGVFAGQLGDGRVVNLAQLKNAEDPDATLYEIQIKGAGLTPYSRFADGRAVLRSSVREFLGSEAVAALGIPTTRALAITGLPGTFARRERGPEECALVTRMAESWVRLGSFTFAKRTGGIELVQKLCDHVINDVYGGVDNLEPPNSDEERSEIQANRYVRLYRTIVKRNAYMLGRCQVFGFLNGVLNTDNTSVLGLSIDYGPFAFMDSFDPLYTPNHDDGNLRYSWKQVPTSMWWNLVRLGEDVGELLAATLVPGALEGKAPVQFGDDDALVAKAQKIATEVIKDAGDEYQLWYQAAFDAGFQERLGLTTTQSGDHALYRNMLGVLEDAGVDFNQFFRALGQFPLFLDGAETKETEQELKKRVRAEDAKLLPKEFAPTSSARPDSAAQELAGFLVRLRDRLALEGSTDDSARKARSDAVNPKFVLKNYILDEVIDSLTNKAPPSKESLDRTYDTTKLDQVLQMCTDPFKETWGFDVVDEMRWTGEVPKFLRDQMLSCSS